MVFDIIVCAKWGECVCVPPLPRSIAASRVLPLCSHNSLSYSNDTWQASALSILIRCTCNQSIKPTDRHFIIWAVCCLLCMCWTWYRNIDGDDNNHHLYLCFRIKHPKLKVVLLQRIYTAYVINTYACDAQFSHSRYFGNDAKW